MTLRELFIQWLTASRFIKALEAHAAEQRQDFLERLGEKDARIKELRIESQGLKLECDRMKTVLMPLGSSAGAIYAAQYNQTQPRPPLTPAFIGYSPMSWQAELEEVMKEEESKHANGERREEVHESATDDAA